MMATNLFSLRAWVWLMALLSLVLLTQAQSCYYPSGDLSTQGDTRCGSTEMCCPLNWQCLTNGLCYLESEEYLGRYTCADETWGPGCPNICTNNGSARGNEAILKCDDGRYCCDGNRSFDCCADSTSEFFDLDDGTSFFSISSVNAPTAVSNSPSASSSPAGLPTRSATSSRTQTHTTVISSNGGAVSTVYITTTQADGAQPDATQPAKSSSSSHTVKWALIGTLVGAAVFVLLVIGGCWLWKRRGWQSRPVRRPAAETPISPSSAPNNNENPSEIGGRMISKPAAELQGSPTNQPSPTVSSMTSPRTPGNPDDSPQAASERWGRGGGGYGGHSMEAPEYPNGAHFQPYRASGPAAELPG
ncbi:hypothetical protein K402DRAFT_463482 [Aulographum hederae CBS 113979]|uniref:Mid2 domain-containing protein n=1 Tax=Aulographum hederae CBS 113979 TaxID=1176131 RepID=A0A6G1H0M3_9PEZI|nr:hypothetical protein K402DRAFT_463482 [Aulographum hederae CBS 113979]